jgi:hypothetical protein
MEYNDETQQEIKSECPIADSELCYWIGKNGCEPCYVRTLKDKDDKIKALENWKVMLSNLPRDIDSLHESDKCVLCKGEPNDRDCYASIDLAHPEPKAMKGMFFGFGKKVRTPVGSLVTVNMAACKSCRKKHFLMDALMWFFLLGLIVLAFVLVSIPAFAAPMSNASPLYPVLFVVVLGVLGYFLGKSVANIYRKRISNEVKTDLSELPLINYMFNKGWFYFQDNKGVPKLFFKTKKTFGRIFPENCDLDENVEKQS